MFLHLLKRALSNHFVRVTQILTANVLFQNLPSHICGLEFFSKIEIFLKKKLFTLSILFSLQLFFYQLPFTEVPQQHGFGSVSKGTTFDPVA